MLQTQGPVYCSFQLVRAESGRVQFAQSDLGPLDLLFAHIEGCCLLSGMTGLHLGH